MKSLVLAYLHILSILVIIVVIGCALPSSESNENAHNEALNAILHEASEATNKGRYEEAEGHYLAALEKIGTRRQRALGASTTTPGHGELEEETTICPTTRQK